MAVPNKRSVGHPTKYIEEYAAQAQKLCKLGAIDSDLAGFFQVSTATIWHWMIRYPAFNAAVRQGKDYYDDMIELSLAKSARGFTVDVEKVFCQDGQIIRAQTKEYYPPNPTSCIFWLKNRRSEKWRDKHELDMSKTLEHKFTLSIFESKDPPLERKGEILELEAIKPLQRVRRKV